MFTILPIHYSTINACWYFLDDFVLIDADIQIAIFPDHHLHSIPSTVSTSVVKTTSCLRGPRDSASEIISISNCSSVFPCKMWFTHIISFQFREWSDFRKYYVLENGEKELLNHIVCCFRSLCEESRLEGEEQRAARNHHYDTYILTWYTVVFIAIIVENVGFSDYSSCVPTEKQQPTRTFSVKSCIFLGRHSESVLLFRQL